MVWIMDLKIFLRWFSVDLQVQPLPRSLCQHLELSRCSCSLCCACRSWGAAVSISSTGVCQPWAEHSGHSLPIPSTGSHMLLEKNPKCWNALPPWHPSLSAAALLMPRNLGGLFLFSVFISWVSRLVSLFKNSQKSVIRAVGAYFFPDSLSLKQDKFSQN